MGPLRGLRNGEKHWGDPVGLRLSVGALLICWVGMPSGRLRMELRICCEA